MIKPLTSLQTKINKDHDSIIRLDQIDPYKIINDEFIKEGMVLLELYFFEIHMLSLLSHLNGVFNFLFG